MEIQNMQGMTLIPYQGQLLQGKCQQFFQGQKMVRARPLRMSMSSLTLPRLHLEFPELVQAAQSSVHRHLSHLSSFPALNNA